MNGTRDEHEMPIRSTSCDPDCDAVCHEDHTAGHKKQHWPYDCPAAERYDWGGSDFIAAAVKRLRSERDAATARAGSATVLPERWRALIAERDAAVRQAREAEALTYRIIGAIEHAYALNTYVELEPGEEAPTIEGLWAEVRKIRGVAADSEDGWTAEENAEFEQRYGIQAAMHLRAANDRVWRIVQELRQAAVDAGRDPYQDPMARRLSAALVGAEGDGAPRRLPSGPTTEYRYVLADGNESEFELHNEGPCGCRREERPVYVGDWRPAPRKPSTELEKP